MNTTAKRTIGPARIVALALIAVAIGALGYLRLEGGADRVSVPTGAHAGQLTLKSCGYDTENGRYPADCGTLVVPENRADPHSRLIALPVTRIRARSAHPGLPIFRLEGGPGITNMKFARASRLADEHDVVLVGYRGVDGSSRLDCPEVVSALKHSADLLGAKSKRAYTTAFTHCASRLQADGVDLAGYTLPQRVDDLEAARRALGYRRIDLISESAGTRTAMIYGWRHPKSIQRSVMISVNPPGHYVYDPKVTDEQIGRYSRLCAHDASCSGRTDDLAASMRRTSEHIPNRWMFLPIKQGNVKVTTFFGLMQSTDDAAPINAPMTIDTWLSAANGDASGFWFMSLMADVAFPTSFVWGELASTGIQDAQVAQSYYDTGGDPGSILGNPATEMIWGGGGLIHAWPHTPVADQYRTVRTTSVETLLVGGTLDVATPVEFATRELLPHLPNGHQVILPGFGHAPDFWTYQAKASTHMLTTYFGTGRVDDSLYTKQTVDFTSGTTQPAIAKIAAGTAVSLALIAALSLLLMWRRVRAHGSFGRKASATLRTLYPAVLGLGGWLAGALFVLVAMPTVPLDDELLGGLSIGLPVGLGIYWAWVDRGLPSRARIVGLAAAVGGALVGAWLGFNATTGMLAVLTTIVGAAAGGNLTVLALDIAWERLARERVTEPTAPTAFASAEA